MLPNTEIHVGDKVRPKSLEAFVDLVPHLNRIKDALGIPLDRTFSLLDMRTVLRVTDVISAQSGYTFLIALPEPSRRSNDVPVILYADQVYVVAVGALNID